jgi:hypothetical protein
VLRKKAVCDHTFALVCAIWKVGRPNRETFFTAALAGRKLSFGARGRHYDGLGSEIAYRMEINVVANLQQMKRPRIIFSEPIE